jgi:integrase
MATVRKRVQRGVNGTPQESWVADYRDQHGKRHIKTFDTKTAAKAWLIETQGEVGRGVHTPEHASVNVAEAARLWLEHGKADGLERGTLLSYATVVRLHIGPTLGPVKLAKLSTPLLEGWRDRLLAGSTHRAPLTRRRARAVLAILKSILAEAQRRGLVAQNAALSVKVAARKREARKLEVGLDVPGKPDIQRLLTVLGESRWQQHRPLFITAIFTGMRASELRGLPWSAVNFAEKTITIRQRADAWGTLGLPKSAAGQRDIPLSPLVLNTLREWKLACPKGALDLVFPNAAGKPRSLANTSNRVWYPLQKAAGLVDGTGKPRFNFHTLRHFAASNWIAQGFSPKRVQAMLGHSSVTMTFDVYGHLFPSAEDDQAKLAAAEIGLVVA